VRLLLDTHVALWWHADDRRLRAAGRRAIAGAAEVWVSAASAWEVSIKVALGKLRPPGAFDEAVEASGFRQLPVTFRHAAGAGALPLRHRDPFDRMLVAQAQLEDLTLVTHDDVFDRYGVAVLRV
jgi:PIN domain nuclease of toxin-antitoxin system